MTGRTVNRTEILSERKMLIGFFIVAVSYLIPSIWFASELNSRVAGLETGTIRGAVYIERIAKTEGDIIGLKTDIDGVKTAIGRIDKNMQKIADKLYDNKR